MNHGTPHEQYPLRRTMQAAPGTLIPGNILCGVQNLTFNITPQTSASASFAEILSPPAIAKFGVAALTGFAMAYVKGSFNLVVEEVILDPIPDIASRGAQLTGKIRFNDDTGERRWKGSVSAIVMYFAPYWS